MRLVRLALALIALSPLSAFVFAQPAMAQANCRWDLDGEWVGQRTGNRVMQEMRPGGFMVWVVGSPKPGQVEGDQIFRDAGPKAWTWTFPNGQKTFARLEPSGLLRVANPDGWNETFKRIRPATPPKCVPVAGAAPAPARAATPTQATARPSGSGNHPSAAAPALGYNPALAEPSRMVRGLNLEDLKALLGSEGYRVTEATVVDGGIQVNGVSQNGTKLIVVAGDCQGANNTDCKDLSFIRLYEGVQGDGYRKASDVSRSTNLAGAYYGSGVLVAGRYVPIFSGVSMQYLRENLRSLSAKESEVRSILQVPPENSGGI